MDATDQDTLPLRGGCWVMCGSGTGLKLAKVKACYRSGGKVVLDLWMHAPTGDNLGRTSPAMGGPRSFEPACDLDGWVRIEPPRFPLDMTWVPAGDGRRTMGYAGTTVIPFGSFGARKPRASVKAPSRSDYDPASEAAARRLAAQELRDLARTVPDAAAALRQRATDLEAEADAISPRR